MNPHSRPTENLPEIVLDISRLVSRLRHDTPTGVDRVEMAYAVELLKRVPDRLSFGLVHPTGLYGRVPRDVALSFLDETEARWSGKAGPPSGAIARASWYVRMLWKLRPHGVHRGRAARIMLQSSPHHLDNEKRVRRILRRENAHFICLVHDLIPIEFPEYARPGGAATHHKRMRTIARLADATIANSAATAASFSAYAGGGKESDRPRVAHLGLDPLAIPIATKAASSGRPYFLCLGTIEPRKNHLLLLNIWRRLAEIHDKETLPKLIIVGRRGWENEQIVDMLERCPGLEGLVDEHAKLPDSEVRALLGGASALLLPSFAEGYGMPVTEALAAGIPVICSDLPALREAGGEGPDYLDPLDGPGWTTAILEYARADSARRSAQLDRIGRWNPPSWAAHIDIVLHCIQDVARSGEPAWAR